MPDKQKLEIGMPVEGICYMCGDLATELGAAGWGNTCSSSAVSSGSGDTKQVACGHACKECWAVYRCGFESEGNFEEVCALYRSDPLMITYFKKAVEVYKKARKPD